jgi:hypothetical protein
MLYSSHALVSSSRKLAASSSDRKIFTFPASAATASFGRTLPRTFFFGFTNRQPNLVENFGTPSSSYPALSLKIA